MTDWFSSPSGAMPYEVASILPIFLAAAASSSDAVQVLLAGLVVNMGISRAAVDEAAAGSGVCINERGDLVIASLRLHKLGGEGGEAFGLLHDAGFGGSVEKGLELFGLMMQAATPGAPGR